MRPLLSPIAAAATVVLLLSPALAQAPARRDSPGFVPGINQPTPSTVGAAEERRASEPARDRANGDVAPPSAISSGVQVMAPARR